MFQNINDFKDYKNFDQNLNITVGNNEQIKAIGSGTIILFSNETNRSIILSNVLHVPDIVTNLVSISQSNPNNYWSINAITGAQLYNNNNELLLTGKRIRNLFEINAQIKTNEHANITKIEEQHLWHQRFGHIGWDTLSVTLKNYAEYSNISSTISKDN
ncbi:hypothetical protein HK096_000284 [Nowakowskiella sp. JEL0078]|nr:hypothetical protein HK096_000284 [Nowakowskiella sp. JEL0078]